jgi:toxin ParE1/3/4
MIYKVVIEPRAIIDIQDAIDYYDSKQNGLGTYFYQVVEEHIETVSKSPFFQIRYKDYHGFPIRKFPLLYRWKIENHLYNVCF